MPRLLDAVLDRRSRALDAAEKLAASPLGINESVDLEQRLDDFNRYDGILTRIQVTEPPLYRHGGPYSFFRDAHASAQGDFKASERLARYQGSETRDVGTGGFAGLTIPAYLVELHGKLARASRPLVDAVGPLTLPDKGMQVSIGKTTTGSAAASQATENSGIQETDLVTTAITAPVRTIAGRQDVSRQAFERGEMVDAFIAGDLLDAVNTEEDRQVVAGTGTSGQLTGILAASGTTAVTYTDASPTVAELYVKITSAAKQSAAARKKPPNVIVLHSRRWYWLTNAVDTATAPIVKISTRPPSQGPFVGTIAGTLGVLIDDNIPTNLGGGTNEDAAIVCRLEDLALLDTEPKFIGSEQQAGPQTIVLTVGRYAAFTAERWPAGIAILTGTGLVDPGSW